MAQDPSAAPVRHLSAFDAVCVIVGIVIGAGIFSMPSLVAGCTRSGGVMLLTWLAGGLLCMCGALCYAELATAYPQIGGEYVYLSRALGKTIGFLFIWARATVIQTGSIAFLAYVFGNYLADLAGWGYPAPMLLALLAAVALTVCNVIGLRAGRWTQNMLTTAKVLGVLGIIVVGLAFAQPGSADAAATAPAATAPTTVTAEPAFAWPGLSAVGLAMVFVLYTFGGWNEAAYVAGELRHQRRNMLWVLLAGISLITVVYLGANFAYLRVLGIGGMTASNAVAADAMRRVLGSGAAIATTVLVAVSALGALDGCIFTGSRAICAFGNDHAVFRPLGRWHGRFRTPANAIAVQSAIAVVLIVLPGMGGSFRKALGSGLATAVEYTFPAFWSFFLLTGVSLVVLRFKEPHVERPFRVPLFPVTVTIFCATSAYMLYRSLDYRLGGAMVGACVLLAGVPVYFLSRRREGAKHNERP